jgi:hypothetical protein
MSDRMICLAVIGDSSTGFFVSNRECLLGVEMSFGTPRLGGVLGQNVEPILLIHIEINVIGWRAGYRETYFYRAGPHSHL